MFEVQNTIFLKGQFSEKQGLKVFTQRKIKKEMIFT